MTEPPPEAGIGHNSAPLAEILAERHASIAPRVEAIAERANNAPRAIKTDADLGVIGSLLTDARALFKEVEDTRVIEKEPHISAGRIVDAFFSAPKDRLDRIRIAYQKIADDHARAVAAAARQKALDDARKANEEAMRQAEIARKAEEANRPKTADKHEARAEAAAEDAARAEAIAAAPAADLVRQRTDSGVLSSARTEWAFEITDFDAITIDKLRPYLKREHVEQAIRAFVKFHKNATPLPGVRIFEDVKATFR